MSDKIKTTKEEREAKKALKLAQEKERVENMCVYEKEYEAFSYICGIDEAGRGPLALLRCNLRHRFSSGSSGSWQTAEMLRPEGITLYSYPGCASGLSDLFLLPE